MMKMKTMSDKPDPYANKPSTVSDANAWHQLSFQISIDQEVDWDNVDLKKWAHTVARFTALLMAKSTLNVEELEDPEVIKTLIMGIEVSRVSFITDDGLHNMIDEFEE